MKTIDCTLVLYVRGYPAFSSARTGEVCFRWFRRAILFHNSLANNLYPMLIPLIEGQETETRPDRDVWDSTGARRQVVLTMLWHSVRCSLPVRWVHQYLHILVILHYITITARYRTLLYSAITLLQMVFRNFIARRCCFSRRKQLLS